MPYDTTTVQQIARLTTHELFESLYNPQADQPKPSYPILINFTASWCGPCQRIDWPFLLGEFGNQFAQIYKCDVDENKYTGGFCGVRSIPSWMILHGPKNVSSAVQISETAKVASWIFSTLKAKGQNK